MIFTIIVLVLSTVLGGVVYVFLPQLRKNLRLPLIFVGSYLFAITIIHLIPELFTLSDSPSTIGVWILIGFFLQQVLEYFTSGVEHGHFHVEDHLSSSSRWSLIIALIIHSILEGSLLMHDSPFHEKHESYSLLLGIVLHKAPAAFALMVTLNKLGKLSYLLLFFFSIASPFGVWLGSVLTISTDLYLQIFAIVCGSFLHISTTIFVETSPNHHFGINKMLISLLGAFLAIVVEFFL